MISFNNVTGLLTSQPHNYLNNMEDKTILKKYISKRKKEKPIVVTDIKPVKVAWYERPLSKEEFIIREAKDKKLYIRHKEWSETIYIGPYKTKKEVDEIIDSYINTSLEMSLSKKIDSRVHSILIESPDDFFVK